MEVAPGVELLATGGHVPGHQSVLVRLPRTGPVLLAGDAVAVRSQLHADRVPRPFDVDPVEARASVRRLLQLVERERVSLVVSSHDAGQWAELGRGAAIHE